MSAWREAVLLTLLAVIPAVCTGWLHPKRPVWSWSPPAVIQVELETVTRWRTPVLWVDARPASAYVKRHVPDAISLNETEWELLLPGFIEAWRPDVKVVVYCDSQTCNSSEEVARRLRRELNLDEVFVLKGGWSSWLEAHP